MSVHENDIVKTLAKSRCEIALIGGKVRIGQNSELEITLAYVKPMEKNFEANLKKGDVWVAAKAAFGEKKERSGTNPNSCGSYSRHNV